MTAVRENADTAGSIVIGLCVPTMVDGDLVWVDRKAHTGLLAYRERLGRPIILVSPRGTDSQLPYLMDHVRLSRQDLPYEVIAVAEDCPESDPVMQSAIRAIRKASLFYGSPGDGLYRKLASAAIEAEVPFVAVVEYSLRTEMDIVAAQSRRDPVRRVWRSFRTVLADRRRATQLALARQLHCNGYPSFEDYARCNPARLLYLDSRLSVADIVDPDWILRRYASRASGERPARLIFSGRYEKLKGTDLVLDAAIVLAARRADFEMDFFGKGTLMQDLRRRVVKAGLTDRIRINDAVPYPALVDRTRSCDVFVSGAAQGDPSCTYLETLGCGVPIVGVANEMWRSMAAASQAGIAVPTRLPGALADSIDTALNDSDLLIQWSINAIEFARRHTFEREWERRCSALEEILDQQ